MLELCFNRVHGTEYFRFRLAVLPVQGKWVRQFTVRPIIPPPVVFCAVCLQFSGRFPMIILYVVEGLPKVNSSLTSLPVWVGFFLQLLKVVFDLIDVTRSCLQFLPYVCDFPFRAVRYRQEGNDEGEKSKSKCQEAHDITGGG